MSLIICYVCPDGPITKNYQDQRGLGCSYHTTKCVLGLGLRLNKTVVRSPL